MVWGSIHPNQSMLWLSSRRWTTNAPFLASLSLIQRPSLGSWPIAATRRISLPLRAACESGSWSEIVGSPSWSARHLVESTDAECRANIWSELTNPGTGTVRLAGEKDLKFRSSCQRRIEPSQDPDTVSCARRIRNNEFTRSEQIGPSQMCQTRDPSRSP